MIGPGPEELHVCPVAYSLKGELEADPVYIFVVILDSIRN